MSNNPTSGGIIRIVSKICNSVDGTLSCWWIKSSLVISNLLILLIWLFWQSYCFMQGTSFLARFSLSTTPQEPQMGLLSSP